MTESTPARSDRTVRILGWTIAVVIIAILTGFVYVAASGISQPHSPRTMFESTTQTLESELAATPGDSAIWVEYVQVLTDYGRYSEAERAVQDAYDSVTESRVLPIKIVELRLLLAEGAYDELIALSDDVLILVDEIAALETDELLKKGLSPEAIEGMSVGSSERSSIYVLRARAYREQEQWDLVVDESTKALNEDALAADVFTLRGIAYLALGDEESARADFESLSFSIMNRPAKNSTNLRGSTVPQDGGTSNENGRRRQIVVLTVILLMLLLLLAAVGGFIWKVASPPSAGKNSIDTGSEGMRWVRSIYGWGPDESQRLNSPTDVAFGPDGVVWTNDQSKGRVLGFSPDGTLKYVLGDSPDMPLLGPVSVSVSESGEVYVADMEASHIFVFDRDGALLRSWRVNNPRDVEVIDDLVYVCAGGGIGVYSPEGELVFDLGTRGGGEEQFDSPQSSTQDDEGHLYFADTLNSRIKAYASDGELEWIFPEYASDVIRTDRESLAGPASTDASGNAVFDLPTGATIDASGRLLVIDAFSFSLLVVNPESGGEVVARYGEQGQDDGKFWYPSDIAFDDARDWVAVADTKNNRVQLLEVDGTGGGGLLTGMRRGEYGPVWVCVLPLVALLVVLVLVAIGRRRNRESTVTDITVNERQDR